MPFSSIIKLTIPVMMGYVSTGMAFGLLAVKLLIPWYYVFFMSLFIYAGSAQFLAATLFASLASYLEIFVAIFLLNLRHSFYGLSMIRPLQNMGLKKLYLIFGLTDETFALLQTTSQIDDTKERERVFTWITFLNQIYWIVGSLIGALIGSLIEIKYEGISFALTALFVVLSIELYKKHPNQKPLLLALIVGGCGMVFLPSSWMLIVSLGVALVFLLGLKEWIHE